MHELQSQSKVSPDESRREAPVQPTDPNTAFATVRKWFTPALAAVAIIGATKTVQADHTTTFDAAKDNALKATCGTQWQKVGNSYTCNLGQAQKGIHNNEVLVTVAGRQSCGDLEKAVTIESPSEGVKVSNPVCNQISSPRNDVNHGTSVVTYTLSNTTATDSGTKLSSADVTYNGNTYSLMWSQSAPGMTKQEADQNYLTIPQGDERYAKKEDIVVPLAQPLAPQQFDQSTAETKDTTNKPWIDLTVGAYGTLSSLQSTRGYGYQLSSQYNIPFSPDSNFSYSMGVDLAKGRENMYVNNILTLDPDLEYETAKIGAGPGITWNPAQWIGLNLDARGGLMYAATGSTPTIHNRDNEVWELEDSSQYLAYGELKLGPVFHIGPVDLGGYVGGLCAPTGLQIPKDREQNCWLTYGAGAGFNTK